MKNLPFVSNAVAQDHPISRPAPWYDCTGMQPGNYINPRDCTSFIICDAGLQAIEHDCQKCFDYPSDACTPQGRFVYNATVDRCLPANETKCEIDDPELDGIKDL